MKQNGDSLRHGETWNWSSCSAQVNTELQQRSEKKIIKTNKKKKEDPIPEPVITLTILENAMAWYKSGKNRLPFICTIELPAPGVYKPFLKRSDG